MEQPGLTDLEREYCPALEAALVYAIYSDFEGQSNALGKARAQLDLLRDSALAEQFSEFDPSGTSGQGVQDLSTGNGGQSQRSTISTRSDTDMTSFLHSLPSPGLGLESSSSGSSTPLRSSDYMNYFQGLDDRAKEMQLAETFPTLKYETIQYILNKCQFDFEKAVDELLNHVLFEELDRTEGDQELTRKGIDAFAVHTNKTPGRKKKGKRKSKFVNMGDYTRAHSERSSPTKNRWDASNKDISFISSKVGLDDNAVWSLYHKSGASLCATISSLIEREIENTSNLEGEDEVDAIVASRAIDLVAEFSLDPTQALALIRLTHPSSAAAYELAKVLVERPAQSRDTVAAKKTLIIPQYAPLNLESGEMSGANDDKALPSLAPSARPYTPTTLAAQRAAAFSTASTLHHSASSTNHRGAAAAYYAQLGRDYDRAYRVTVSSDADELVASQRSSTSLDLHGVGVRDALRIARAAVHEWWDGLGERRVKGWRGNGTDVGEYRIVTGVGRHSNRGKAKIGPAVGRMLMREGWKVEVGSGVLGVVGRVSN